MSYNGVITCGKEYAARVNIDEIPWKPWRAGSCYEWNQSKKYAGDGMLVRKRGKRIFFHLSVYPNEYAFDEIERRMLNPRVGTDFKVVAVRCECGKVYRPKEGQDQCTACLVEAQRKILRELQRQKDREQEEELQTKRLKAELSLVRAEISKFQAMVSQKEMAIVAKDKLLKEFEVSFNKIQRQLIDSTIRNKSANAQNKMAGITNKKLNALLKGVAKLSLSGEDIKRHQHQLQLDVNSTNCLLDSAASRLDILEERICAKTENTSMVQLLRSIVEEDLIRWFSLCLGKQTPNNRNIREHKVEKVLREYPKPFHSLLCMTGITFESNECIPLSAFLEMFQKPISEKIKCVTNFGSYINFETDKVSVGHMCKDDLYDLVGSKEIILRGEIPREQRISLEVLECWRKISVKFLASSIIEYLFKINFLNFYKRLTHARILLKEKAHSLEMLVEVKFKSYRKTDGKLKVDKELSDWQQVSFI